MIVGLNKIRYELDQLVQEKPMPHTIFTGPRGTGKTTLAKYVAEKSGCRFQMYNAPALDKHSLYSILLGTKRNDIIFIDEIHRLAPAVEEILYQPMEGLTLTLPFKNRVMTVDFPPFTLLGATTRPGMVSRPMLSRFRVQISVPPYTVRDLTRIVANAYQLPVKSALSIARNTMVPREALGLAERIARLHMPVDEALEFLNFKGGYSAEERQYLKLLANGSLSLQSIAGAMQYEPDSVEHLEERLLHNGMIEVTGKGRQLTAMGLLLIRDLS